MNITTQLQQAASLILKSQNIVLMPHAKMDCDGMSASVGLYLLLQKLGKNPTAVCADPVPEAFSFLPSSGVFSTDMPNGESGKNDFLVTVDTHEKGFKDLKYTVQDGKVNIIISSDSSPLQDSDFSFIGTSVKPDLIITLDSGDTKQLGSMYTDNFDLFESVPVINIDHHVSNTQFGDVNLVDFKSCSTTELVYKLLPLLSPEKTLLDANISTLLLAGMLTDTGSFQHSNTTPESLDVAADLIQNGARHQEIVKHLFKTKSLATLRVWGRVLTKLQSDPIYRIVWSSVSRNDLEETQAHSDETEGLIDELMATTPGTELVLLVKEREDNIISTSVRSSGPEVDSIDFTAKFGGGGHKQAAGFKIRERGGKSFDEIVADIIFEAKKFQADRLNISVPKRDLISILENEKENAETSFIPPQPPEPIVSAPASVPNFPDYSTIKPEVAPVDSSLSETSVSENIAGMNNEKNIETSAALNNSFSGETVYSEPKSTASETVKTADADVFNEITENNIVEKNSNLEASVQSTNNPVITTPIVTDPIQQVASPFNTIENINNEPSAVEDSINIQPSFLETSTDQLTEISTNESNEPLVLGENEILQEQILEENIENIPVESFLSPAETEYLNAEEYKISAPEREIEKDEGEYIDDFADFLSKADDHSYITEDQASTISFETKNKDSLSEETINTQNTNFDASPQVNAPETPINQDADIASSFGSVPSGLNTEDEILQSISSPAQVAESIPNPLENPLEETFIPQETQTTPVFENQEQPYNPAQYPGYDPQYNQPQNFVPPVPAQSYNPAQQENIPFVPQGENQPFQPEQVAQNLQNTELQQDPFLQSLRQQ